MAATKNVTVLIFDLFWPQGSEGAVNRAAREVIRVPWTKNGGAGYPAPPFLDVTSRLPPNLRRFVELRIVQIGVEAAQGEQLVVRALLDDVAVANHQDHIGVADRGQAVRDDKARAALH